MSTKIFNFKRLKAKIYLSKLVKYCISSILINYMYFIADYGVVNTYKKYLCDPFLCYNKFLDSKSLRQASKHFFY